MVALEIEKNGYEFYQKAAELFQNNEKIIIFEKFALMEKEHRTQIKAMAKEASKRGVRWDILHKDGIFPDFLRKTTKSGIFNYNDNPASYFNENSSLKEIYKIAISMEKDAIVFYSALSAIAAHIHCRAIVLDIMKEEIRHLTLLSMEYYKLNTKKS